MAGQHARVVHQLAAARQQLRRDPARAQRRADEGHPPRGGRGREGATETVAQPMATRRRSRWRASRDLAVRRLALATFVATFAADHRGRRRAGVGLRPRLRARRARASTAGRSATATWCPASTSTRSSSTPTGCSPSSSGFMILALFVLAWRRYRPLRCGHRASLLVLAWLPRARSAAPPSRRTWRRATSPPTSAWRCCCSACCSTSGASRSEDAAGRTAAARAFACSAWSPRGRAVHDRRRRLHGRDAELRPRRLPARRRRAPRLRQAVPHLQRRVHAVRPRASSWTSTSPTGPSCTSRRCS